MKKSTIEEVSAGGVVYRTTGKLGGPDLQSIGVSDKYEFLIGKHSGYHKWVLPKGLVERGESYPETAEREVFEEVGVRARVVDPTPLKTVEYDYFADMAEVINKNPHTEDTSRRVKKYQEAGGGKTKVHKKVIFYLMEVESDLGEVGWEMEERQWLGYEQAVEILAFESEREVLVSAGRSLGIGAPAET